MKKKFIESSLDLIKSKKEVDNLEEKRVRYGLEGFYNTYTKFMVMLILSLILGIWREYLLLILVYSSLRLYGFGIHMETTFQCWVTTIPLYIGGCLVIKYFNFPLQISLLLWLCGFISFLIFAPADTPKRPLIYKEKRVRAKVLSLIILLTYFLIFNVVKSQMIKEVILLGVILESISINPLLYKLFNMQYNNYKYFMKNLG